MSELQPETRLAHYRIISKIGAGGMGEVYLAQDTKLDRKVAIKLLNEEFSKDQDKLKRFIQEAKSASALNHPNILTVYEIGEADNKNYIAIELIDGHTLREHLRQQEPLPLNQILKIGVQVAEALAAAHAARIIHRDIKPENIMIRRDGYAKVLDFGLAKLSERPAAASGPGVGPEEPTRFQVNTNPGVVMGTVFYMSPEQARGTPIDARTDIWSLGVVLYEMLARRVPFSGETTSHTMVAILENEPAALENAPSELQRIVRKALTKDVDMRYQSAPDLLIDLKNLRRDLDIKGEIERSIVPTRDPATVTENETRTFAPDATRGGQAQSTRSSSSLEYAVNQAKSHKVATAIVAFLIVGVITTVGYFGFAAKRNKTAGQINSIAVMPFVNLSGNSEVEYLSDGLTDSLIFRISQLPNLKVSPTSSVMRFKATPKDVAGIAKELEVDAVLTGRLMQAGDELTISVQLIDARTQKLVWAEQYDRKMADLLATQREIATTLTQKMQLRLTGDERGITKKFDPNFALAYAAIAATYNSIGKNPDAPSKDCIPLAKAAAMHALEIDPMLPQAHSALGDSLAIYEWDWAAAEQHFKKALELDPNISYTHVAYGIGYLTAMGSSHAVVTELERAVALEPVSMINNVVLASAYIYDRNNEKALAQARSSFDLDPTFPLARHWYGMALIANGKYDDAIALGRQVPPDAPFGWVSVMIVAHAYASQGKRAEAEREISLLRELSKTRYVRPYYIAAIHVELGDTDKAFAELERSLAERDCYLPRITVDPLMDPLRSDPRFKSVLKRMNLAI